MPEGFKGFAESKKLRDGVGSGVLAEIRTTARIWTEVGACRKGKEGNWMKESNGGKELDAGES